MTTTSRTTNGSLRLLLLLLVLESVAGLFLSIAFTLVAAGLRTLPDAQIGAGDGVQFAAAGAFILAIAALIAVHGARRRRTWAWTLAALLQLPLAIGTGVAVLGEDWHPAYLIGFVLAALVMIVLSLAPVRRALGQG